jgi:hypothetical protein
MKKATAIILAPSIEPHDDPRRVIGRRTRYHGDEPPYLRGLDVAIVAVLKDALRVEEHAYLTDDDAIARAGGVTAFDRIEVAPFVEKDGRFSFATSDPKAVDLAAFAHLAKRND